MTRKDYSVLFSALGFMAVILRSDTAKEKEALRAISIARLIESFCVTQIPEAFGKEHFSSLSLETHTASVSYLAESYLASLKTDDAAELDHDRKTLLGIYEYLTLKKLRHEQRDFYRSGHDDVIANRIATLADEVLATEGE